MKKLLLIFLMYALAHIGARAGNVAEITSWNATALVIQTNGDVDLESIDEETTKWDSNIWGESWYTGSALKIVGDISQTGLNKIESCMINKTPESYKHALNLSEATIKGDFSAIPVTVVSAVLPAGTNFENLLFGNISYVYSAPSEDNTANLYVGTASSLDDIVELDVEALKTNNTVINLSGDAGGKIKAELIGAGISEDNIKVPVVVDNTTLSTTVENLKTDLAAFIEEYGKESLKNLIITDGTVTLDVFKYIATSLPDIVKADFTHAEFPEDMHLADNDNVSVNWEILILPEGTKIAPYFSSYPNLKFAVAGAFNKIWLVSQKKNATDETSAFGDILSMIPQEIKDKPATDRIGVAFVGNVTVDDVVSVVGMNGPLKNARIWHFYDAKGLTMEDFAAESELLKNLQGNNENPTGLVLVPGADVDKVGYQYNIGNIYSLSKDEETLTVKIRKTETFDIARFTTTKTRKAVFVSDNNKVKVDDNIISALKGTKRAVSVDLSRMNFPTTDSEGTNYVGGTDEVMKHVTTGNVKIVTLPEKCAFDISHYNGTTIGVISRIKNEGNENIAVTYQRVPGTLNKVRSFRSDAILDNEYIRYRGNFNMHDLESLFVNNDGKGNKNIYYDLSDVKVVKYVNGVEDEEKDPIDFKDEMIVPRTKEDGLDMSVITNDYVKYIALPESVDIPENPEDWKMNKCPMLCNVGTFNKSENKMSFYSFEEGTTEAVVKMLIDDDDKITSESPVKHLVMGGKLKFCDIAADQNYFTGNGNCDYDKVKEKVTSDLGLNEKVNSENLMEEESINGLSDKPDPAFSSGSISNEKMSLVTADFSKAVFPVWSDFVLFAASRYSELKEIKLPMSEDMTIIPDGCLSGLKNINELCIPANYTEIGRAAFREMLGLNKITTTQVEEGNITDRGDNTIVLSFNLKSIGTGAFWGLNKITDVYVLATTAPKCASGAFDEATLYGNNGFKNSHPVQRMNYVNGDRVIGMLHYPRACKGTQDELNYTDISRVYTLFDETGEMNGYGELLSWPKHEEFGRSWQQARTTVPDSDGKLAYTWNAWPANAQNYDAAVREGGVDDNYTYDTDYMGWHEFVLAESYYRKAPLNTETRNYSKFKENDWYTLCVPYNITRSMLLEYLGTPKGATVDVDGVETMAEEDIYPVVRTLVQVKRSRNNNLVTFIFCDDLTQKEINGVKGADVKISEDGKSFEYLPPEFCDMDDDGDAEDPIIIKGGYPYIIKPYLPKDVLQQSVLGNYLVDIPKVGKSTVGYTVQDMARTLTAAPYPDHKVHAIDADKSTDGNIEYVYLENEPDKEYFYHFTGTYSYKQVNMPMYSFFIGKHNRTGEHMFFRVEDDIAWTRYTAVIGGRSENSIEIPEGGKTDDIEENIFLDFICDNDFFGADKDGSTVAPAKFAMSFDTIKGETTGISELPVSGIETTDEFIYSINGKCMGTSTIGLPKGVYIMNGNKFVVK